MPFTFPEIYTLTLIRLLQAELNEKDALLDEMDSVLKERALQQEELLTAMLRVADEVLS
jgi:hypothetical protein